MKFKALIILCLLHLIFFSDTWAQCTPSADTEPGIYPDTTEGLPDAIVDSLYEVTITLVVLGDTVILGLPIQIDSAGIISFKGLPYGFTWITDSPSDYWLGDSTGCIKITGTPVDSQVGVYPLNILARFVALGSFIDSNFTNYKIVITANVSADSYQENKFNILGNYPNPFSGNTEIIFTTTENAIFEFEILDIYGKVVHNELFTAIKGKNKITFNSGNLSRGIYIYRLNSGKNNMISRMMITD